MQKTKIYLTGNNTASVKFSHLDEWVYSIHTAVTDTSDQWELWSQILCNRHHIGKSDLVLCAMNNHSGEDECMVFIGEVATAKALGKTVVAYYPESSPTTRHYGVMTAYADKVFSQVHELSGFLSDFGTW